MSQQKQAEYSMELKLAAVRRVRAGESVRAVAEELGIRRKRLYVWKDRYAELGEAGLRRQRGGRPRKEPPEGSMLAISTKTELGLSTVFVSRFWGGCTRRGGGVREKSTYARKLWSQNEWRPEDRKTTVIAGRPFCLMVTR